MNPKVDLTELAGFLPPPVLRYLASNRQSPAAPYFERYQAAVLFADISGFTALTERLAQRGPQGTEELTGLLNAYFGQLIELISSYGGEVVKFAGDALLALWPAAEAEDGSELGEATRQATECSQ